MFGHPVSRERSWRICIRKAVKKWACRYSLQELADLLLIPKNTPLPLDYNAYLFQLAATEVNEESDLTEFLN